jgi:hypothetical protein
LELSDFVVDLAAVRPLLVTEEVHPEQDLARWLAIGVAGTAVVRKSWSDDAEVSPRLLKELLAVEAPEPSFTKKQRHRALEDGSAEPKLTRCRSCAHVPGRQLCPVCGGSGSVGLGEDAMRCPGCEAGKIVCSACEGGKRSYDVRIAYHEDAPVPFAHVFVPENVAELRAPIAAFIQRQSSIPGALTLDLTEDFEARDAYRGRRGDHERHGHRFGGALTLARRYLERIVKSPSVVDSQHTAMAWPFATLTLGPRTGFAVDPNGTAHRL